MTRQEREFPFAPKSSARLVPGDFWAVPLSDGSFGCGRVIELPPSGRPGSRVGFLGALLDWRGTEKPTFDSIAGAKSLEQGFMHVLAITQTGGAILGTRPLALDDLTPFTFVNGAVIQRGFSPIREFRRGDAGRFRTFSTWGYDVIAILAEKQLLARRGA